MRIPVVDADTSDTTMHADGSLARWWLRATVEPGSRLRVVKLLAYHWASDARQALCGDVDNSLNDALTRGFEGLATTQRAVVMRSRPRA